MFGLEVGPLHESMSSKEVHSCLVVYFSLSAGSTPTLSVCRNVRLSIEFDFKVPVTSFCSGAAIRNAILRV